MIYKIININNFKIYKININLNNDKNIYFNLFKYIHKIFGKDLKEFYVSKVNYYSNDLFLIFININNNILNNFVIETDSIILNIANKEIYNFKLYKKSIEIAKEYHKNQTYDRIKLPYFYHLKQTDKILNKFINVLPNGKIFILKTCAILHDILEDTDYTYNQMISDFSKEIADIVVSVTKNEEFNDTDNLEYEKEYYEQILKNNLSIYVKFADKCANNIQNTKVLSKKRAIKSLEQHKIFKDVIFDKFDCDEIKEYLENIMKNVYEKNIIN